MNESEIKILVLLRMAPLIFLFLLIVTVLIGDCSNRADPLDNSILKAREIVESLDVTDSLNNGFRITYVTVSPVTRERLEEISSRPQLQEAWAALRREAPLHFNNNMLRTDIYDFVKIALKYDVGPDVKIHCIFVTGAGKVALYAQPNPSIPNSASWINPNTEQGVLWIDSDDVYSCYIDSLRTYRYWKCPLIYSTSHIDEQFSHFSETDRLY